MQNFELFIRTRYIFGKGSEDQAGWETAKYTKRLLLHHSGGHAVKSGLIGRIKESLKNAGLEWIELDGVQANPRLSLVYKGIDIVKNNKLEFILAVGGGSVIDSAKAIALGAVNEGDVWDFFERKKTGTCSLPIGCIVTIPAAGSESSNSCVITDERIPCKRSANFECNRPLFALLNPALSFSLPPEQTAFGIFDTLTHIMERYFTCENNAELSDEMCEGAMRAIIRNARCIFAGGWNDYNARAEIMWAAALAHNNIFGAGRIHDWASHGMSHELSALYDLAHGAALSVIFPAWLKYNIRADINDRIEPARFARFAAKVWGVDGAFYNYQQAALEGVLRMENFLKSIGLPVRFSEAGLASDRIAEMAGRAVKFGPLGNYRKLDDKAVEAIFRLAAEN